MLISPSRVALKKPSATKKRKKESKCCQKLAHYKVALICNKLYLPEGYSLIAFHINTHQVAPRSRHLALSPHPLL